MSAHPRSSAVSVVLTCTTLLSALAPFMPIQFSIQSLFLKSWHCCCLLLYIYFAGSELSVLYSSSMPCTALVLLFHETCCLLGLLLPFFFAWICQVFLTSKGQRCQCCVDHQSLTQCSCSNRAEPVGYLFFHLTTYFCFEMTLELPTGQVQCFQCCIELQCLAQCSCSFFIQIIVCFILCCWVSYSLTFPFVVAHSSGPGLPVFC